MYFILSKLLIYLLFPLSWVFILFITGLVVKDRQRKKKLFIAAVIVLYVFSNSFLFNWFAKKWDVSMYQLKSSKTYNCSIVLGGFSGGKFSNKGHFNGAADRFIQCARLFTIGKTSHLLLTGGSGSLDQGGYHEAAWAKTQLEDLKIPDSAILVENNSKNTIENARFSGAILKQSHLKGPYLLVTSAFHMRRALMIFKKQGIDVIPYSSNFIRSDNIAFDDFFIPDAEKLAYWNIYIKEVVGCVVNYFNG